MYFQETRKPCIITWTYTLNHTHTHSLSHIHSAHKSIDMDNCKNKYTENCWVENKAQGESLSTLHSARQNDLYIYKITTTTIEAAKAATTTHKNGMYETISVNRSSLGFSFICIIPECSRFVFKFDGWILSKIPIHMHRHTAQPTDWFHTDVPYNAQHITYLTFDFVRIFRKHGQCVVVVISRAIHTGHCHLAEIHLHHPNWKRLSRYF